MLLAVLAYYCFFNKKTIFGNKLLAIRIFSKVAINKVYNILK